RSPTLSRALPRSITLALSHPHSTCYTLRSSQSVLRIRAHCKQTHFISTISFKEGFLANSHPQFTSLFSSVLILIDFIVIHTASVSTRSPTTTTTVSTSPHHLPPSPSTAISHGAPEIKPSRLISSDLAPPPPPASHLRM